MHYVIGFCFIHIDNMQHNFIQYDEGDTIQLYNYRVIPERLFHQFFFLSV